MDTLKRLWELLIKNGHWFLLVGLEIIALGLTFNGNLYHRFVNTALSSVVLGGINDVSGSVRSYIHLREANRVLLQEKAQWEQKYVALKRSLEQAVADTLHPLVISTDSLMSTLPTLTFCHASVTFASTSSPHNMLTINKGTKDGVRANCGVVSAQGVVGIVAQVTDHYASVVPLINTQLKLSCRALDLEYTGSLLWNKPGSNTAMLTGLPTHSEFPAGAVIVTSGFSDIFPEGIIVGTVEGKKGYSYRNADKVPVRLATDFYKLKQVYVITDHSPIIHATAEVDSLESSYSDLNPEPSF